jgi:hypothetical protein
MVNLIASLLSSFESFCSFEKAEEGVKFTEKVIITTKRCRIDKTMPQEEWKRETVTDKEGVTRKHTFTVKNANLDNHNRTLHLQLSLQDELTEVLGIKALRNLFKTLEKQQALNLISLIEKSIYPEFFKITDASNAFCGIMLIFPKLQETNQCLSILTADGTRHTFTKNYNNGTELHQKRELGKYFCQHGRTPKAGLHSGYNIRETHKKDYKEIVPIAWARGQTRLERAQSILSQLQQRDH